MSSARSKGSRRYILVAAVLVVIGVVVIGVTTSQSVRVPVVVGAAIAFGLVFLILSIVKASERAARKNSAAIGELCTQQGLLYQPMSRHDDRDAAFAPFEHLDQLRTGSKGLVWIATDPTGRNPLTLLQHRYVVSTGQTTVQIVHTIAALPCPPTWPILKLGSEHLGHRIADMLGKGDLKLESDEFNKRWFVKADDEDFATLVLSPEMQEWLIDAPKWATFHIEHGQLVCAAKKAFKPEALPELIELCHGFANLIAPELQAWVATA